MGRVHTKVSKFIIAVLLVLALGVGLRLWAFGEVPESLYWDEIAMLLDARSVAETGKDMHSRSWLQPIFPSYGDYKLPVYIWLTTVVIKIVGVHEWVVRVPSLLAGVGTIVLSGVLTYEFLKLPILKKKQNTHLLSKYPTWVALATMFVVSVSPWSILFSRTGFEGHVAQFLVALSAIVLVKIPQKWLRVVLASCIGALATYTYFSVRYVWPVVFIGVELWILSNNLQWRVGELKRSSIKVGLVLLEIAIGIGVFFLCLQPMVKTELYDVSNFYRLSTPSVLNSFDYAVQSNEYRERAGNTVIDRVVFHRKWLLVRQLLTNVSKNTSLEYVFVSGDQNLRHGTGQHGLFLLPFVLPFLVGLIVVWSINPFLGALLIVWWMAGVLPASVPMNLPHALRSLNALMPLSILIGIGMAQLVSFLINIKQRVLNRVVTVCFAGVFGLFLLQFIGYYIVVYPKTAILSWQGGFRELAQEVMKERDAVETILIDPFDQRFYLWMFLEGYTSKEIQAFTTKGFQHHDFDRYLSDPVDWLAVKSVKKRTVVVGPAKYITEKIAEYKLTPVQSREVKTTGGVYLLVVFSPYQ